MTTTTAKERPILFSGPMVRAILDGRKTQTRRVARMTEGGHVRLGPRRWHPADEAAVLASPYGQPGDRLWVRETWQHEDGSCDDHKCGQPTHIYHKATESFPESMRWKPSIFMPRWASRLTLEVTDVRVQRVQKITEEDAKAEGVEPRHAGQGEVGHPIHTYRTGFVYVWHSINAKRGFGWEKNPWVWVIEFTRCTD